MNIFDIFQNQVNIPEDLYFVKKLNKFYLCSFKFTIKNNMFIHNMLFSVVREHKNIYMTNDLISCDML